MIIVAGVLIVILLSILEEHLKHISETSSKIAEEMKDRLIRRSIALAITIGIIQAFSVYTGVDMATELFATIAGAIGITVGTVVQNEMELKGL